jgi:D-inositol-3-phosphate glycosyltransferase
MSDGPRPVVAVLTGGHDRPYVFGLAMALARRMCLDVIGGEGVDRPEFHATPGLNFLNLRDQRPNAGVLRKAVRVLAYYARLIRYSATSRARIFHILWNNKFEWFDRTLLAACYKLAGKKIVYTVHNVNAGKRDGNDSALNRLTLRIQYRLADHLFVHTEKMKRELIEDFGIAAPAVTVIPFGINNSVPDTSLTPEQARERLGIRGSDKVVLFFGSLRPYKGLEYLAAAFSRIAARDKDYRLIVAGEPVKEDAEYLENVWATLAGPAARGQVLRKAMYVPDEDTELYFKAADVSVLPYTLVFQSGVLFLAYSFGLPVIATSVGSFHEDIVEGRTGFTCNPRDSDDLARAMERYFASGLYRELANRRADIREYAHARHSWDAVGDITQSVYSTLVEGPS